METKKTDKSFSTINPATEETLATYNYMNNDEVESIIQDSHKAFNQWRMKTYEERGKIIKAIGQELQNSKAELSELMTDEMGKLLKQSKQEIDGCTDICDYAASKASEILKNEERELPDGGKGVVTYSPIGIIYGIQPWNYPAYQVIRYAITNLMAGNSILLKHASNVTGTGLMLESIFKTAGLPKGLFRVLIIDYDQSDKVVEHKLVRGVTLTGSSDAGRLIGKKSRA